LLTILIGKRDNLSINNNLSLLNNVLYELS
jgi:hypothetical protein